MRSVIAVFLISMLAGCTDSTSVSEQEAQACGFEDLPATYEQCKCVGGIVRFDIGDGSTRCDDDETLLTTLPIGIEPVLCCLPDD